MRAIVFDSHGGTDVLTERDVPIPTISATDILLRIRAIGVNYNDVWARRGLPGMDIIFPHISGSDASGVVEEVGSEVETVKVGDEVVINGSFSCGMCVACVRGDPFVCPRYRIWGFQTGPYQGAQAEYARVPARNVLPRPTRLTWEEAASLPLCLVTAWRMLVVRARVQPGDFVLVWGAAGGLGTMAVQICRLLGARPIAVASTDDKLELCTQLGAEFVINRSKQRVAQQVQRITGRQGVQVVFEHVGAATWPTSVLCLAWGGTIVTCGATTGFQAPIDIRFLWNKQQNYIGSHYGTTAELADALDAVERGLIRPVVMDLLPLKDVARAHELLEADEVAGKIVMLP